MISKNAIVETDNIGEGTKIWHFTHVRENVTIGSNCIIGSHCYIDAGIAIGNNCKIQSGCLIYKSAKIGDGVFLGPRCLIINDKHPRAINDKGGKISESEWKCESVTIEDGASVGAGAIIMPGITIGKFATVGAGAVVTKDVLPNSSVKGIPAEVLK